jgi:DNA helicase-2/ATP-dependent DNA helicase PcrA
MVLRLNEEQQAVLDSTSRNRLVIASAGTGKTATMVEIARRVPDINKLMFITFTRASAKEIVDRLDIDEPLKYVGTFHSVFLGILEETGHDLGVLTTGYQLKRFIKEHASIDLANYVGILSMFTSLMKNNGYHYSMLDEDSVYDTRVDNVIREAYQNGNINQNTYSFEEVSQCLVIDYIDICESMERQELYDYDDILLQSFRLLNADTEFKSHIASEIDNIIVDEYQDTNKLQMALLKTMVNLCNVSITVVGDPAQSIYGFRGSRIENIEEFDRIFPDVQRFNLVKNYRSAKNIIRNSNRMLACMQHNMMDGNRQEAGNVFMNQFPDIKSRNRVLVRAVQDYADHHNDNYKDIAIIARTNRELKEISDLFTAKSIPFKYNKNDNALAETHNAALIGIAVYYVTRNVNHLRAAISLLPGIGKNSLELLFNVPRPDLNVTVQGLTPERQHTVQEFLLRLRPDGDVGREWDAVNSIHFSRRIFSRLFDTWDGYLYQHMRDELSLQAYNRFSDILNDINVFNLIDAIMSLMLGETNGRRNSNAVTLCTMHGSKGLEFDAVFVISCNDKTFDKPEERRLFYVASSRAKDLLVYMHAEVEHVWGMRIEQVLNQFLVTGEFNQDANVLLSTVRREIE